MEYFSEFRYELSFVVDRNFFRNRICNIFPRSIGAIFEKDIDCIQSPSTVSEQMMHAVLLEFADATSLLSCCSTSFFMFEFYR